MTPEQIAALARLGAEIVIVFAFIWYLVKRDQAQERREEKRSDREATLATNLERNTEVLGNVIGTVHTHHAIIEQTMKRVEHKLDTIESNGSGGLRR
jgi:hypothetical protein